MKGKIPKSIYYDKYGPSGSFTKAAEGSSKITQFFPKKSHESNDLPSDWREILDNSDDSDADWEAQDLFNRIEALKNDIITNQNKMSILEYNKKRAIF
jgi:hypothetical protein